MSKVKYHFNQETLSYERITTTIRERLNKWGIMFVVSVCISVGYYFIYSHFFDTPKERVMTNQLSALKFQYQILSHDLQHIDWILSDIQKRDDDIYRTILESDPIPASIRQAGFGGVNRYEPLEGYDNSNLMIALTKHTEKILKQLFVQSLSYDELIYKVINKEQIVASRPAIQPISNKDLTRWSSAFSRGRLHPILGFTRPHNGIDISAPTGTNIYATGNGTVIRAVANSNAGLGRNVQIDHGFGLKTVYGHMHRVHVSEGDEVKRGDIIGTVGSTGLSQSPHLHYEVHLNERPVDPINYFYNDLSPDDYVRLKEQAQENDILETW